MALAMTATNPLACDGCGQPAGLEHIARRLRRLESTTRYRPVHINTLFLGASSPTSESEFLYAGKFEGEAGALLDAIGLSWSGKMPESVLADFQRSGFFLTHLLECPPEASSGNAFAAQLAERVPAVHVRIRRSLKPKRVVMFSPELETVVAQFSEAGLGCPLVLDGGKPFSLGAETSDSSRRRLRDALFAAGVPVG
jgi:hypothetical protein